jgi:RHS repeat-associated protein
MPPAGTNRISDDGGQVMSTRWMNDDGTTRLGSGWSEAKGRGLSSSCFGNTLAKCGLLADVNNYRFSSKEWNGNSGLYYYLHRFYDPNLQRWVNRDPVEEYGGVNLYEFVMDNPTTEMDPLGFGIYLGPGDQSIGNTVIRKSYSSPSGCGSGYHCEGHVTTHIPNAGGTQDSETYSCDSGCVKNPDPGDPNAGIDCGDLRYIGHPGSSAPSAPSAPPSTIDPNPPTLGPSGPLPPRWGPRRKNGLIIIILKRLTL